MEQPESAGSTFFLNIAVCIANLAAFTCGTSIGWSSPVIPKLNGQIEPENNPLPYPINNEEESWLGCFLPLGAAFGPIVAGILVDKIGRKKTLMISVLPFIVGFFTAIFARNIILLFFVRIFSGLGLGAIFTVLPMFVGEIAEDKVRGALGSYMQLFITAGILYSYVIGPYVSIAVFNVTCLLAPTLFLILFYIFIPESPYYLVAIDETNDSKKALMKLRTKPSEKIQLELEEIKKTVNECAKNKGGLMDIFKLKGTVRALVISIALVSILQLSGINVILFYTQTIFEATGSSIPAEISTIIIGVVQVLASFVAPLVVDKIGKRFLLLLSAIGMGVSEAVLGYYFYLHQNGDNVEAIYWLPIASLICYNIFFCIGFGPLTWAIIGELFPSNIKSVATTLTTSVCWFLAFIITKFFINLNDVIGMGPSFWILTAICGLGAVFVYFCVPETTGKSLQDIQKILNGEKL